MQANNIVVSTDFSKFSEAALRWATSLARDTGAMLHIVHVKEPMAGYRLHTKYGELQTYPELSTLKTVLERVIPSDPKIHYRHWLFTSEHVAEEILGVARETNADLIVVGTHGRKGLSRLLVGSVAERVLRSAHCPVLTVKDPPAESEHSSAVLVS